REAESAGADAFRREGRLDPDERRRADQTKARRRLRDLRLSRRPARLQLRRARQLSESRRRPRLAALDGVPGEERKIVSRQMLRLLRKRAAAFFPLSPLGTVAKGAVSWF